MTQQPISKPTSARQHKAIRQFPALTGLRAVAAYLVFLHHYNPATLNTFAYQLFDQGYIGVTLFFVLSGFLIYYRYANDYFGQTNWSWRGYLQNRFARISPLHALLLLATVCINAGLGHPISLPIFALNLTLLKGFFDSYKFSGLAQSWSLTVELCFYGLAPLLFGALRRWSVFIVTIGLVCIGLILWATIGQLAWYGLFENLPFVLFYTFFGRAFEFVAGMWLARRWRQNSLPKGQLPMLLGLVILATCIIWQACFAMVTTNANRLLWSEVVVYNGLLPVGISLLFVGLLTHQSVIRQWLSLPIMQALGESSYAFFLIHIGIIASGLQKLGVANQVALFVLLIGISYGLHRFVEKPLAKWFRVN